MTIEKTYTTTVPPKKLFHAWVSPDSVVDPVTRIESDPKAGGHYKLYSGSSVMHGVFQLVDEPRELRYTWCWDSSTETTEVHVRFKPAVNGTVVKLSHSGFLSEDSRAIHDAGWDSYVKGLVALVGGEVS